MVHGTRNTTPRALRALLRMCGLGGGNVVLCSACGQKATQLWATYTLCSEKRELWALFFFLFFKQLSWEHEHCKPWGVAARMSKLIVQNWPPFRERQTTICLSSFSATFQLQKTSSSMAQLSVQYVKNNDARNVASVTSPYKRTVVFFFLKFQIYPRVTYLEERSLRFYHYFCVLISSGCQVGILRHLKAASSLNGLDYN